MRTRITRASILVALVTVCGCAAEQARDRLERASQITQGRFIMIEAADFAAGKLTDASPSNAGSAMLRDCAIADSGIANFVRAHGVPDAIAVTQALLYLRIDLAYRAQSKVYVIRHGLSEALASGSSPTILEERVLTDEDLDQIDPVRKLARATEALRQQIAADGHVNVIGRRLVRALPLRGDGERSSADGHGWGFFTVAVFPPSVQLFGLALDARGRVVAWIDPDGPATALHLGDLITAVDGTALRRDEPLPLRERHQFHLTVERAAETFDLDLTAEAWRLAVTFSTIESPHPNAFAGDGAVSVTTGMLALLQSDDELAAAIAHELAHITERHVAVRDPGVMSAGGAQTRFTREQERVADEIGVRYAAAAGYDPAAAISVLERLSKKLSPDQLSQYLDTHPAYPERIRVLRQAIRRLHG